MLMVLIVLAGMGVMLSLAVILPLMMILPARNDDDSR